MYSIDKHKEIIERSHQRCIKHGLSRDFIDRNLPLSKDELKNKLEKNKRFIELAIPYRGI